MDSKPNVDVIMTAYNEPVAAIDATINACLRQTHPVTSINVIDDGSRVPITYSIPANDRVRLIRLEPNVGICAARNAGIRMTSSPFVACINIEVLPSETWVEDCLTYLRNNPEVGAVCGKTLPEAPRKMLNRWRMRFHEPPYPSTSGFIRWAPGHAVFFRREALEAVKGYDERFRRIGEDVDICDRLREKGLQIHYLEGTTCLSIQQRSLGILARQELVRSGWVPQDRVPLIRSLYQPTRRMCLRSGRHILSGRIHYLPLELAIWGHGVFHLMRHRSRSG